MITNTDYLSGLLTLDFSLKKVRSAYPLVALYTDTFPASGHAALAARGIPSQRIEYLLPSTPKDFSNDPRFYDCWSKLVPFSLTQYERVVQLDSDMMVLQNMDELMDIPLDASSSNGKGDRVFAAANACVCNPLKKPHYPKDWIPANCANTYMHNRPEEAQTVAPDPKNGLGFMNGGLQVVVPSAQVYQQIIDTLNASDITSGYEFADQSLLTDIFRGRWVPLPYIYNALKFMRNPEVHGVFWRDDKVKNIHYILSPKPWDLSAEEAVKKDPTFEWWWAVNKERTDSEARASIVDGF